MLELSTLGLLQREPLHGYRLKQQLELFMSSCISVNYGAIYPLLKRLEERGYIATLVTEEGEAGPNRKIYCVTDQGRMRWHQKMLEHPHESWVNSRSRFAIKFFFFSYLEPSERVALLKHRLSACQLRIETINAEYQPLGDPYQESAAQRCVSVINSEIAWLTEQLAQEQNAMDIKSGGMVLA
ncbi:MAG TPA: PadR family transcriptional regulator [Cyanobacteria bacterium UBA12227]|nr:PadR family transcriptional regulator [Cyanobacteria bacterium UBA12227]HAX88463.1 PadR family transcriptional regulator [Cyanobacteria bacterium UBA11370]HBY81430.1 PadR family transcriptional regulator [Cyanobacteria bacterium UBA11148]